MEKVTTGPPLSEAETAILDLMDNAKFKRITVDPKYCVSFYVRFDSTAPALDTSILTIGQTLLEEISEVYCTYPEVVKNALPFAIEHETAHIEGDYSAGLRIKSRYANSKSYACLTECEYKANLQAMVNRLKASGMTFEKVEEEVAAFLWLIPGDQYRKTGVKSGDFSSYIEETFPKLGEEFKEQIDEKILEIDKEYRRRCKEKLDREASPLSFGHTAVMPGETRKFTAR